MKWWRVLKRPWQQSAARTASIFAPIWRQAASGRGRNSSGAPSAPKGAAVIAELVQIARQRILILPGSSINPSSVLEVAKRTRAREFHSGLSTALPYIRRHSELFQKEVQKLALLLAGLT